MINQNDDPYRSPYVNKGVSSFVQLSVSKEYYLNIISKYHKCHHTGVTYANVIKVNSESKLQTTRIRSVRVQ